MISATSLRTLCPQLPAGILYGGDYNPEQWPEEVWREDARLMREAGVNLVSVAIFAWARLEPRPGEFDFAWLDRVIALLWEQGVSVCLATATAAPPAWLARAHPESLPVEIDGTRLSFGARQHYCLNSRAYRERSAELCRQLGRRYGNHPAVALWHINNEIGCHVSACYCDVCATEFRVYLKIKYESLPALNQAWGTEFWGQRYGEWGEIQPPRKAPTFRNPSQTLDYHRFMSDAMRDILIGEIDALRSEAPAAKVTTNGLTFPKPNDYWEWYRHVDVAAWDAYPDPAGGLIEIRTTAFCHDLFRSLKGGRPFILMEQVTSQVNWRPTNVLKPPGQMRALSYQAVARGADGVMFFQWRASKAGAEKFHGAMLPHYGPDGRVHREVRELGRELKRVAEIAGTRVSARVALVVSWPNRWALEFETKPTQFDYQEILHVFYAPLWELNIAVDLVPPDAELESYDVVIAPALYQLAASQAERLRRFVDRGGALVMTYFSGVVDEQDQVWLGGYPALLQDVLGLAVEEWQPLAPGATTTVKMAGNARYAEVTCTKFCEGIDLRGATVLATYHRDLFAGRAALTRHAFGQGEAFYFGTLPAPSALVEFFGALLKRRGIQAPISADPGVELSVREGDGRKFLFVVNHLPAPARVDFGKGKGEDVLTGKTCAGEQTIEPFGVRVVRS